WPLLRNSPYASPAESVNRSVSGKSCINLIQMFAPRTRLVIKLSWNLGFKISRSWRKSSESQSMEQRPSEAHPSKTAVPASRPSESRYGLFTFLTVIWKLGFLVSSRVIACQSEHAGALRGPLVIGIRTVECPVSLITSAKLSESPSVTLLVP